MIIHELDQVFKHDISRLDFKRGFASDMDKNLLITFAAFYRPTLITAEIIATTLNNHGLGTELSPVRNNSDLDISRFSAVIIGGDMRLGQIHADLSAFVQNYQEELALLPVAYFLVGTSPGKPGKNRLRGIQAALDHFCRQVGMIKPISTIVMDYQVNLLDYLFPGRSRINLASLSRDNLSGVEEIQKWTDNLAITLGG